MPSFYKDNEYDLAGFAVGIVEKGSIIDGSTIGQGDAVIGLRSNGFHSNGFSLVRKVFFEIKKLRIDEEVDGLPGKLFEELLKPTRIYVKPVLEIVDSFQVKGMAHITGGGLPGNISRIIPDGLSTSLRVDPEKIPHVFKTIMRMGNIDLNEMCSTFNMGTGFVLIVNNNDADKVVKMLGEAGEEASRIGTIEKSTGDAKVIIVSD